MPPKSKIQAPYTGPERRANPRIVLDTMVDIVMENEEHFFDFALNFSKSGFFFETEHTLTLNQTVEVLFPLPLQNWIYKAKAVPIWHYKNPDETDYNITKPEGYGFKIITFDSEDDAQKIEDYIQNPPDFSIMDEIV